jgi:hypothetical protein
MNVYAFSSETLTNIWAGIGARQWAIANSQGELPGIQRKAAKLPIGAFGLFYCTEMQSLTTPFVVRSKPNAVARISNVWAGEWFFPFGIIPLGTPELRLHKDEVKRVLPAVKRGDKEWHHLIHFQPTTVFAASQIPDDDWQVLVDRLAGM